MTGRVHRIQRAGCAGEPDGRSPICSSQCDGVRVQIACARIARDSNQPTKLESVRAFAPGNVIDEIVQWDLEIVAKRDALVRAQKFVPLLVGVADQAETLACKSPVKRICDCGTEYRYVTEGKAFTVIGNGLFGGVAGQKRRSGIAHILQIAAPEKTVSAISREVIVEARDKGIIVQTGRRAEDEPGVIQSVASRRIVGWRAPATESATEITRMTDRIEHRGINTDTVGIEIQKIIGVHDGHPAVHV